MGRKLIDAYRLVRQDTRFNATAALMVARRRVEAGKASYPRALAFSARGMWQPADTVKEYSYLRGAYSMEHARDWRTVGYADEVCRSIGHTGHFTSDEGRGGDKLRGVVLQLPARRGVPRFVPAYEESTNDGLMVWPADISSDKDQTARTADRLAEIAAESERDYQDAWRAGSRASLLEEEAMDERISLRDFFRSVRSARKLLAGVVTLHPVDSLLCEIATEKLYEVKEGLSEKYAERDKLRDSIPTRLVAAFREGAGT